MTDLMKTLYGLRDGSSTFEEVKQAVRNHPFQSVNNVKSWDYVRSPGSWTDTVYRAKWLKLITEEQYAELREIYESGA